MASRSAISMSKSNSLTNPSPTPTPTPSRTCLCSPTKHPGSFRCSMHKKPHHRPVPRNYPSKLASCYSMKKFLIQVIKPSSHDLRRRKNFHPKPTRFCLMNGNRDAVAVSWSRKLVLNLVSLALFVLLVNYFFFYFFCFSFVFPLFFLGWEIVHERIYIYM